MITIITKLGVISSPNCFMSKKSVWATRVWISNFMNFITQIVFTLLQVVNFLS